MKPFPNWLLVQSPMGNVFLNQNTNNRVNGYRFFLKSKGHFDEMAFYSIILFI